MNATVSNMWESYRDQVVPKEASAGQVEDTRNAFYAGVTSIMALMRKIGEDDEIDEEVGGRIMLGLEREVKLFTTQLMAAAMASKIAEATGAEVSVRVHDVTKPPGSGVH